MVSDKNLASAVGGKTARACDSCIKKRARWYCAADDAFLCQACDASVHSANTLARRHERVRLKTASGKQLPLEPSWLHGFTRKARTPRHGKAKSKFADMKRNPIHLVPEMGPDENSYEENEEHEQLLYRVPVIDQFAAELCLSGANSNEGARKGADDCENDDKYKLGMVNEANNLHGNVNYPCDMDLEEFAADVESLLGKGFDEESFDMETLGFLDCQEKDSIGSTSRSTGKVKFEEEEEMETALGNYQINAETDMTRETFELNFDDYDSQGNYEGHDQKAESGAAAETVERKECEVGDTGQTKKKILLALDYEGVIASWADQRSPWTTGDRPELDPNELWQEYMGGYGGVEYPYGEMGVMGGSSAMLDGGREARVSRYREKRRTRLFSKKIRYEVRKLNAEKRPRMKGRFVKRANFPLLTK